MYKKKRTDVPERLFGVVGAVRWSCVACITVFV